jgi:uncharacterized protein (DUF1697 family)
VALLRAVNLGSTNKVSMADLKALLADLGLGNPRSLLVSGNLVFDSEGRTGAQLEQLLEREVKKRLGLDTPIMVRAAGEWSEIIAGNPFPKEAKADPAHLVVSCFKQPLTARAVAALEKAIPGREQIRARGRDAYLVYPDGIGRSRLSAALIEKHLGSPGTARNWNTVLKLAAMLEG